MATVYHPTIPSVSEEVADKAVDKWTKAGWRKSPLPADTPQDDGKPAAK